MSTKRRKRIHRKPTNPEHARILFTLAKALNAADKAKLYPVLAHNSVFTNAGYVLPVGRKSRWQVRIPAQRGS